MLCFCSSVSERVKEDQVLSQCSNFMLKHNIDFDNIHFIKTVMNIFGTSLVTTCNVVPLQFAVYPKLVQIKVEEDPTLTCHISYSFIIIDEAQDMSQCIARFFEKKMEQYKNTIILCCYDVNQSIF